MTVSEASEHPPERGAMRIEMQADCLVLKGMFSTEYLVEIAGAEYPVTDWIDKSCVDVDVAPSADEPQVSGRVRVFLVEAHADGEWLVDLVTQSPHRFWIERSKLHELEPV